MNLRSIGPSSMHTCICFVLEWWSQSGCKWHGTLMLMSSMVRLVPEPWKYCLTINMFLMGWPHSFDFSSLCYHISVKQPTRAVGYKYWTLGGNHHSPVIHGRYSVLFVSPRHSAPRTSHAFHHVYNFLLYSLSSFQNLWPIHQNEDVLHRSHSHLVCLSDWGTTTQVLVSWSKIQRKWQWQQQFW